MTELFLIWIKWKHPLGFFLIYLKHLILSTIRYFKKKKFYSFHGTALKRKESYCADRKQFVQMDNTKSDVLTIITGVPQGSILGPLLFIIYINDIAQASNLFEFIIYAYDTSLTTTFEIIYKKGNKIIT